MRCIKIIVMLLMISFNPKAAVSEAPGDMVLNNINGERATDGTLFLHCDKTLYTNNETIWFAAYLFNTNKLSVNEHHTLSVALVRYDGVIQISERFILQNGLASGSLALPDTIAAGNYTLYAYTNMVDDKGNPAVTFFQKLTVKTTTKTTFNASLYQLPKQAIANDSIRVLLTTDHLPITKKKGQSVPAQVSFSIAGFSGKKVTGKNGSVSIAVPKKYLSQSRTLNVTVDVNNEKKQLLITLVDDAVKEMQIRFYPEGGALSPGLVSMVGYEINNGQTIPVNTRAVLFEDEKVIDTIGINRSGMGAMFVKPDGRRSYYVKIVNGQFASEKKYFLPKPVADAPILSVRGAVCKDTLVFRLTSQTEREYSVLIQNPDTVFAAFRMMGLPTGKIVKLPLNDLPKGVAALTILTKEGNPIAERLFFAHYTPGKLIDAGVDKTAFKPREKVTLRVRLNRRAGSSKAIVSVSVAQVNRLEPSKVQDIESYAYINRFFGNNGMNCDYDDLKKLENVLLIKGWRKYKNDTLANKGISSLYQSLLYQGSVMKGKKPADSVQVVMVRDSVFHLIHTDKQGRFNIPPEDMAIDEGSNLLLSVNKRDKEAYQLKYIDPFDDVNRKLALIPVPDNRDLPISEPNVSSFSYTGSDKTIHLKEVLILGNKGNFLTDGKNPFMNKCGDFVCMANYLNCPLPNHSPTASRTTAPVKGRTYYKVTQNGGTNYTTVTYQGCESEESQAMKYIYRIKGRLIPREFYGSDYSGSNDTGLDYQSTLYWKNFLIIDQDKDIDLTFNTSDLKSPYNVVIQGINDFQVVRGDLTFSVQ